MAKTNNKGFSLIEIVIAVAILSILLTPIIKQFANTLETSRKAKALQEANEMAVYEVEEFQTYSKQELDDKYGSPTVHENLPLLLYKKDGTEIGTINYTSYEYKLPDSELGAKKDKYSNVVVLDDMNNKVRAYGGETASEHYKVAYGMTDTDLATAGEGFELTNEGSLVKYDTNGNITGVVCTSTNKNSTQVSYMQNPNEVNLGNMHDLDKDSVAMVMGGATSFDTEAFSALFSKAMDHLRELDYDSWQQALLNVDNESILSSDSLSSSDRLIKIYTDTGTDIGTAKKYFLVRVDVYYNYQYSLDAVGLDETEKNKQFNDTVSYTIFSQKFYTKEAPEIYFEYQPYAMTENGVTRYNANDYFLFDNHIDQCKLYLYKPYRDQMNANAALEEYDEKGDCYTYYTDSNKGQKVKIHFASKSENAPISVNADDEKTDTTGLDRIYVFTNLDVDGYKEGSTGSQFVSDAYSTLFQYVKGEKESVQGTTEDTTTNYLKFALGKEYTLKETGDDGTVTTKTEKILYKLSEDIRESERLYTITVKLTPTKKSLNTVRLAGAKGVN